MRRSRRGGHGGMEFGGSGEDSFVAVVVTKLTGALLFILLLTMVIMALLPKVAGDGSAASSASTAKPPAPLRIATPDALPDAVAGRPYTLALATTGGRETPRWRVDGKLPEGLHLDEASGRIAGTPKGATDQPIAIRISADDGHDVDTRSIRLAVLPSISPPEPGTWWKPRWPAMAAAWRTWLEQGVGFLVLWLVHLLAMNLLANLHRQTSDELVLAGEATAGIDLSRRFGLYRAIVRLATVSATVALAVWLVASRMPSV